MSLGLWLGREGKCEWELETQKLTWCLQHRAGQWAPSPWARAGIPTILTPRWHSHKDPNTSGCPNNWISGLQKLSIIPWKVAQNTATIWSWVRVTTALPQVGLLWATARLHTDAPLIPASNQSRGSTPLPCLLTGERRPVVRLIKLWWLITWCHVRILIYISKSMWHLQKIILGRRNRRETSSGCKMIRKWTGALLPQ